MIFQQNGQAINLQLTILLAYTLKGYLLLAVALNLYSLWLIGWDVTYRMKYYLVDRIMELAIVVLSPLQGSTHDIDNAKHIVMDN